MILQQEFDYNWNKKLESDWDDLKQFVMWNYYHQHMQISDSDAAHFTTYALGETFDHEHVGAY